MCVCFIIFSSISETFAKTKLKKEEKMSNRLIQKPRLPPPPSDIHTNMHRRGPFQRETEEERESERARERGREREERESERARERERERET